MVRLRRSFVCAWFVLSGCSLEKHGSGDDLALGDAADDVITASDTFVDSFDFDTGEPDSTLSDTPASDVADTIVVDAADSASDGASEADADAGDDLALTCTEVTAGTDVDLTTEGTAGWAHYGLIDAKSYDHKTAPDVISALTVTGGASGRYAAFETAASWTDGTPTTTAAASKSGVYLTAPGSAFAFTVQGDGTLRTVRIYVRVGATDATATLSLGASKALTVLPKSIAVKTYRCDAVLAWSSKLQVLLTEVGGASLSLLSVTLY